MNPRSRSTLVRNRAYSKCRMACSIPPQYKSTGVQVAARSGENGSLLSWGLVYRNQYQDESTNVSSVSVSRRAGPPHCGQVAFRNRWCVPSGLWPVGVNSASSGNSTGSSSTDNGIMTQESQYTTGIGVPQ